MAGLISGLIAGLLVVVVGCARGGSEPPAPPPLHRAVDPALVQTVTGPVRGVVAPDHRLFAGIPFAAPPVGTLRWRPPAPVLPWRGVRDATRFGPHCIQNPGADPEAGRNASEDCLSLNVWTPAAQSSTPRPVMVWIHGGAFVNGSSDVYRAQWLVSRGDIIVVTLNYRLGALGFLAHPALGPTGQIGNYGLEDQQAALRWVRDNIAGFGGDPGKVTIAGESAGAMSVCDHLVAPASVGLFRSAILQSGPCQAQADLNTASRHALKYAAAVGCPNPATAGACLRTLPVDRLRIPVWHYTVGTDDLSGPVTGTSTLPVDPVQAFATGRAVRVPVLMGTTRDEFTLFVGFRYLRAPQEFAPDSYPRLLAETFGPKAAAVQRMYPPERYGGVPLAYSAAVTDGVFSCVSEDMAAALGRTMPVFTYEFNDRAAPRPDPLRTLPFDVGASHSLELRYLFDVGGAPPLTPSQRRLSEQMIDYWSGFVANGVPTVPGQPAWPRREGDGPLMSLQSDRSQLVGSFQDEHRCSFWAGLKK